MGEAAARGTTALGIVAALAVATGKYRRADTVARRQIAGRVRLSTGSSGARSQEGSQP